jgi:hypothetical protein
VLIAATPPSSALRWVAFAFMASAMPSCSHTFARCAPLGVAAGLACTTDFAASRTFLKPSSVETSGLAAPSRTTRPMRTMPRLGRGASRITPAFTCASSAGAGISTMSGFSPAASLSRIALITM